MIAEPEPTQEWAPKQAPIMTRWAKDVSPQKVHPEYPRPLMVRKEWINLNGLWDLSIVQAPGPGPDVRGSSGFRGKILVPFPVESALSGVMKPVAGADQLEYRRTFNIPAKWKGKRVVLHFGAVDWSTQVFVNGKEVGTHLGGYDSFSFDITDALKPSGNQELLVVVRDPTDDSTIPRGKQVMKPEGIWYTPTSGIWQTVWLEPVQRIFIEKFSIATDASNGAIEVDVKLGGDIPNNLAVGAMALGPTAPLDSETALPGEKLKLLVRNPELWSPEKPKLYRLRIQLYKTKPGDTTSEVLFDDEGMDQVESYFAFRTISLGKDEKGRTKIFLNGKPYFLVGPLDQGYWPDGLYTAPSDAALKYDLEITKKLGFNFVRKHVKVEPERWYYHCDKMGLLVFQDMPSGDKYIGGNDPDITRTTESGANFRNELQALIEGKKNHPCIVGWVPYNEGWGQWKTAEITEFVRKLDPTRLVDNPSGWTDRGVGDMHDIHAYPGPASPKPEANRAAFLGEFGGLGLPMPGHMWQKTGWGYRSFKTQEELTDGIVGLFQNLRFLIDDPGLSGAVYTQTTDVEQEVNGLLTYDRAIIKPDAARLTKAVKALFLPPPTVRSIIPTSETTPQIWSYRTAKPERTGFEKPDYDDSSWQKSEGGFGTRGTPGAVIQTIWNTSEIWLRREILIPKILIKNPHLRIHHDEDVEIYLDGKLLLKRTGYTTGYVLIPIPKEGGKLLTPGKHTLAVHCKQTGGGQFVDVGIVDVN